MDNDRLSENVAKTVRQPKPKKVYGRERGFTDSEAVEILKASRSYVSNADKFGYVREQNQTANMKRWVPIICAFTGARVSEITQLRKEDVREEGEVWVLRITPDAGTVTSAGYRDVPLHRRIIEEGFLEFIDSSESGPIFYNASNPEKYSHAAHIVSNKLHGLGVLCSSESSIP